MQYEEMLKCHLGLTPDGDRRYRECVFPTVRPATLTPPFLQMPLQNDSQKVKPAGDTGTGLLK